MARRHKSRYNEPVELAVTARQALEHAGFKWAVVFRYGESLEIYDLYRTKSTAHEAVRRLNEGAEIYRTGWEYELARIDLGE